MTATTSPPWLPVLFDSIPDELRRGKRFVGWRGEIRKDQPKPAKMPYSPDAPKGASSASTAHWVTFDQAVKYAGVAMLDGIMRAFVHEDGLVGIDLDGIRNPETGELDPMAAERIKRLDTYTEISPSGTGVKMWAYGTLPRFGHKKGDVELYGSQAGKEGPCGRFFTMTGHRLPGTPSTVGFRPDAILALHREVFGDAPDLTAAATERDGDVPALQIGDEEVLRLASESAHNGARFRRLWDGDTSDYACDGNEGASEGDLALCEILAYYGGPDEARIERLWLRSGLTRDKTERPDYRERTIKKALEGKTRFYGDSIQAGPETGSDDASGCDREACPAAARVRYLERRLLDSDDLVEAQRAVITKHQANIESKAAFLSHISAVIAKPNEELSAGEKVVSIGLLIETQFRAARAPYKLPDGTEGSYRLPNGNIRMTREVIARRTGYSPNQASKLGRQIAERENAPYRWDTTREWKKRWDGTEGYVTTIEIEPRVATTSEALRAVATLSALPNKVRHGGSPQAVEARAKARLCPDDPDHDVILRASCAISNEALGTKRVTAEAWASLEHRLDVPGEGGRPVSVIPRGHQDGVPDAATALERQDDDAAAPLSLFDYAAVRGKAWRCQCGSYERYPSEPSPSEPWQCDGCGARGVDEPIRAMAGGSD
jgi:putative DNA primase/helicase